MFILHEHDVVNVIDADDVVVVANENDDDWVANKCVSAVMNDMIVEVNEHESGMMVDAYSIDFNLIFFHNENTITCKCKKLYHIKLGSEFCTTEFQQVSRQYCQNEFEKV